MSAETESSLDAYRSSLRATGDRTPLSATLLDKLRSLIDEPVPETTDEIPAMVGPYRVERELGRGGMGVVYEAFDPQLQRRVAVKVLVAGMFADPRSKERFLREARTAASMRHDALVPVYGVEAPPGEPAYLVMPLIDGPTLAEVIRADGPLPPQKAARIVSRLAEGLSVVHAAGIVHRDVKPGNVLLEDGQPKLTDFGLARPLAEAAITSTGAIAGTPSYLSPEQLATPDAIDARTDVYALGVTLYECLSGQPPFVGSTADVLRMIRETLPARLPRGVPRDLHTICLKCLEKKPGQRYACAADLRADLERYLASQTIIARPAGRVERGRRWIQRNPWAAAVIAVSVVGAMVAGLGWWRAAEQRTLAVDAAASAEKARKQASDQTMIALGTITTLIGKAQQLADRSPGTLALKQQLAETALADLEKLSASVGGLDAADLTMIRTRGKLGETYQLLGKYEQARGQYRLALDGVRGLPDSTASTTEALEEAGLLHSSLSVIDRLEGKTSEAIASATSAIEFYKRARSLDPARFSLARSLAVALNARADSRRNLGAMEGALADYRAALAVCESLRPGQSGNSQLLRDLAFTESRLATTYAIRYEFAAAEPHSHAASRYAQEALALDPGNVERQRTARIAVTDRCSFLCKAGDYAEAGRQIVALLPQLEAAAKSEPDNPSLQRDLAVGFSLRGAAAFGLEHYDVAAKFFDASLTIREALSIAVTDLTEIGQLLLASEFCRGRFDRAAKVCDRMIAAAERMAKTAGPSPGLNAYRQSQVELKQAYEMLPDVVATPAQLGTQPADMLIHVGCLLALHQVRTGSAAAGFATLEKMVALAPGSANVQLTALFAHATAARRSEDKRSHHLEQATAFAAQLFEQLPQIRSSLLYYPDLLPLRSHPPFQKLLTETK